MGVLDSSYIKTLGVKWPGLKQIFFFILVTPYWTRSRRLKALWQWSRPWMWTMTRTLTQKTLGRTSIPVAPRVVRWQRLWRQRLKIIWREFLATCVRRWVAERRLNLRSLSLDTWNFVSLLSSSIAAHPGKPRYKCLLRTISASFKPYPFSGMGRLSLIQIYGEINKTVENDND